MIRHMKRGKPLGVLPLLFFLCLAFNFALFSPMMLNGQTEATDEDMLSKIDGIKKDMKSAYEKGNYKKVISIFKERWLMADKEFHKWTPRKYKAQIYEYAVHSYHGMNKYGECERYLKRLMVYRREEGLGDLWGPIKNIAEKYYLLRTWLVGVTIGTHSAIISFGDRISSFSSQPGTDSSGAPGYKSNFMNTVNALLGLQQTGGGIVAEKVLTPNFLIKAALCYSRVNFSYENTYQWMDDNGSENLGVKLTHDYRLGYLDVPVMLKYRIFSRKPFSPYIQVGGLARFRLPAYKDIAAQYTGKGPQGDEILDDIDIRKQIRSSHPGIIIGAGAAVDFIFLERHLRLEMEYNYKHIFYGIISKKNRFDNEQLLFGYYDAFNDIKMSNHTLSINFLLQLGFTTKVFKNRRR